MADAAPNQFALLKTRRFLPLFLVLFLGAFNDQVFKNAYIALVTFAIATNGVVAIFGADLSIAALSLIANILFILPFALISPTAGQITDNVDKRAIIRFVKISEVVIMALAVYCFFTLQIEMLLVVLFLLGAQSAVFAPVKYAVMPQYLDRRELLGGNGLAQAATFLAIIFGTILGTQVILFDGGIVAVSVIVMIVAGVGLIAAFATPSAPPVGRPTRVDWVLPRAMVKLVLDCRHRRVPFTAILFIAWFWFVGVTFMSLLAAFVEGVIGGDKDVLTALLTCFSVGVAIGALLSERIARGGSGLDKTPYAALGIGALSVVLWLVTPRAEAGTVTLGALLAEPAGLALFVTFIALAVSSGIYITPLNTLLQRSAPPKERARYIACSNVIDSLAMVVSSLFGLVLNAMGLVSIDIFLVVGLTSVPIAILAATLSQNHPMARLAGR